jgi:hypothetical protein
MAVSETELRTALSAVRRVIDDIEKKLDGLGSEEIDPYVRRRMILMRINWSDNDVSRDELMQLLEAYGTNYAWIGQQVKKGYLQVKQVRGQPRYSVTKKAIKDEELEDDGREEAALLAQASHAAFAEDWDSEEDSRYDAE